MADRKTMAGLIAIGVGCRKSCASAAIVALVRRALAQVGSREGDRRLFTSEDKHGEQNLARAAGALGLELNFLARGQLLAEAARAVTHSERVERLIGLPGLAETAALAGAGRGGELIVARIASDGATCAIAYAAEAPE
jgi:cobalt-precorrin 5A hydrolase